MTREMSSLQQRSYSGQCFRPKPLVELESESQSILVATSWNGADDAQFVIKTMKEILVLATDPDGTSMSQQIDSLGVAGNRLRGAALTANEALFLAKNRESYQSGVELLAVTFDKNQVAWVQVGATHLFVKNAWGMQPLSYMPDHSWQLHQKTPLVSHCLGLSRTVNLICGTYQLQPGDNLILVGRSYVPSQFYQEATCEVNTLSRILVDESEQTPFWLGILAA